MLKEKLCKQSDIDSIEEGVEKEVLAAVSFADESPFPEKSELYTDMFVEDNPYFHV